jgi:L-2-hydroxyglutarate oxidase LhgO
MTVRQRVDAVVIGAGVVGMACAEKLARRGDSVLVIERNARAGQETSSRNSGVIHAGLYYPPGSLKAELCVRGRDLLYARAARYGLPHRKLGKLVVACEGAEVAKLEALQARAHANGANEVRILDAAELVRMEPRVRAIAALWSPETGIVDAHALLRSYWVEAQQHGAELVTHTRVVAIAPEGDALRVTAQDARGEKFELDAAALVNAAGLGAPEVAALAGGAVGLTPRLCKGDYFRIADRLRGCVSHLVYPMPVSAGLGVHLTLDLDGSLRAGPDTEYVDSVRYDLDETKRTHFAEAVRRYLPELRDEDLTPDFAGIRPKLHGPEATFHDFVIEQSTPRLVNLLGIESPGLTASEAIAERVAQMLNK